MRILLVEDDAAIVAALSELLASEGYEVESASRQDAAIDLLATSLYDLALLDVSLEQGSGFAVCAAAREVAPAMPVVFLTASDDEYSTVAGLDMGAVDYIAKPFRARELLARVNAALRRIQGQPTSLMLGDVEIDPVSATVRKRGEEVVLSALEYRLLLLFAQNSGSLISRERMRSALWDSAGEYVSDNAINVYVKRLREKIEDDPSDPRLVVTVRGLGYKAGC
ncbi:response regulator transcription factor [Raoultibacter massiliensis]|uniref:Response regulator transcription factor n=1 Tax=Raoultibacter massiliensis TaxID=1852371 RepID=A0ABV1JJ02_9ACTN|nr:response regulator transcription factor [Raoultibacter massiliensis]